MTRMIKCPSCGSVIISKKGFRITILRGRIQRYLCDECLKSFTVDRYWKKKYPQTIIEYVKQNKNNMPTREIRDRIFKRFSVK